MPKVVIFKLDDLVMFFVYENTLLAIAQPSDNSAEATCRKIVAQFNPDWLPDVSFDANRTILIYSKSNPDELKGIYEVKTMMTVTIVSPVYMKKFSGFKLHIMQICDWLLEQIKEVVKSIDLINILGYKIFYYSLYDVQLPGFEQRMQTDTTIFDTKLDEKYYEYCRVFFLDSQGRFMNFIPSLVKPGVDQVTTGETRKTPRRSRRVKFADETHVKKQSAPITDAFTAPDLGLGIFQPAPLKNPLKRTISTLTPFGRDPMITTK